MRWLSIGVALLVAGICAASVNVEDEETVVQAKKEALAKAEAALGKNLEKFSIKELKNLLSERGVQCAGCSEKSHILERVRETIHLPIAKPESPKNKEKTRAKSSRSERDRSVDDILAKMKGMPGGENIKVFTKDDIEQLRSEF